MKKKMVFTALLVAMSMAIPLPAKKHTQNIDRAGVDCKKKWIPIGGWTCPEAPSDQNCWCVTNPAP